METRDTVAQIAADRHTKRRNSEKAEMKYHNVPSTSKTIPFNGGAPCRFPRCGSRGAKRFAGLRLLVAVESTTADIDLASVGF